ncbi:hypothetical protein D3C80_2162540 [compost metagenome]
MHHWVGAALDANGRRLFVNHPAQGFNGSRLTERQVERVDMAATHVEHAADIVVGRHHFADAFGVEQL